jgi:hydrogenase maturation factor
MTAAGKIISVEMRDGVRIARVQLPTVVVEASLALVPEAQAGDYVTVDGGLVIGRIAEHAFRSVQAS